ncbi:helix-turn-helix domain-containing protein [Nonomuraea sp. NPDC050394]|uniref:helix-turn-helix domain-containing protein n=1 Tax=Nonomuraea sp. NPDC050394 TaxID=3364363 RepID=UPI0037BB664C
MLSLGQVSLSRHIAAGHQLWRTMRLIRRTMITLPANRLDAALGSRFITRQGLGALFRQFLTCLRTPAAECAPQELPALEQTALDHGREEGVAALIRRRRPERCRTDPARSNQPIQAIALRWGFASPSAFTHAFRRAFGITPPRLPAPPGRTA